MRRCSAAGFTKTDSDENHPEGTSYVSPDPDTPGAIPVVPGADGSGYCAHFSYVLGSGYEYPFTTMGINFDPPLNLANAVQVRFWIRGNGYPLMLSFINPVVVTDFNNLSYKMAATPAEWTEITVNLPADVGPIWESPDAYGWSDVRTHIVGFYFEITSQVVGETGEVWVDNIRIIE